MQPTLTQLKQDLELIANNLEGQVNPDYNLINRIDKILLELTDLIEGEDRWDA